MDRQEIEKRLKQLEEENKELKKIIKEQSGRSDGSGNDSKVSRREFLKKLGAGAIGLGALATPVASKMTISNNGIYKDGSKAFLGLSGAKTVSTNLDMNSNDIQNANSIATQKLDVKGETLVDAHQSNAMDSLSSGTWHTIPFNQENKDELNEFDPSTGQFVPDETGWYHIHSQVQIGGLSSTNRIAFRFRNVTDGTNVISQDKSASGDPQDRVLNGVRELIGGKTYKIQFYNYDSSSSLHETYDNTYLNIRRAMR